MNATLTSHQKNRIIEARTEALEIIAKAKSYQPKFWDLNLIATYEAHVAKLNEMLAK